jgi:adenine/guanine/hypoxanthine permease
MTPIKNIDFDDYTESIPVFLTIIMMPLTYSISEGIMFGVTVICIVETDYWKNKRHYLGDSNFSCSVHYQVYGVTA